jgi:imidazolonepropionase-like amidohydrolase
MLKRIGVVVLALALIGGGAFYALVVWPVREPHPTPYKATGVLAIEHARILVHPDSAPIADGTVVVRDGVIEAVGPDARVPAGATRVPCSGCTVTAGFWNVHVHFTEPKWREASGGSAATIEAALADMTLSRGFTTVVDLGSDLRSTLALRRRIEHGELRGPTILTAGSSLYPPHGIPYYLSDIPAAIRALMPQPASPAEARADVETDIARGSDVLKLFTGSLVRPDSVLPMPEPVARAAVEVAHARGQVAFAHPSSLAGMRVAIAAGVDVLAHAPSQTRGVSDSLLGDAVRRHMAMAPTLKMFAVTVTRDSGFLQPIVDVVRRYRALGGTLLFGTDVGYMTDYTTAEEFALLARAGVDARELLRMLTASPAARLGVAATQGTVMAGRRADLVLLDGDPSTDVGAFARVRAVVRAGAVAWERK